MSIFAANNAGTVRFNSGSTTINGTSTFFKNYRAGSVISIPGIGSMQLASDPTSDTVATGVVAWGAATTTFRSFEYLPRNEEGVFTDKLAQLLNQLSNGNIQALAGLTLAADKLPYANGAGSMGLVDFKAWVRSLFDLTAAANKLPYFTGTNTAALTDFSAAARSLVGLTGAANKLPYFTDTNVAALTDLTAKGRAILAQTSNAGVLTEIGAQPADSDLSSIAALTTTGFGRSLLTLVNAAAGLTAFGAVERDGVSVVGLDGGNVNAPYMRALNNTLVRLNAQITETGSTGSSGGYARFPGGLIVQWGGGTANSGGVGITFPIAFPTKMFRVLASTNNGGADNVTVQPTVPYSNSHFTAFAPSLVGISWWAIGN